MEEFIGRGAPSSSSIGFHVGTLMHSSDTTSAPEPSAILLLYCPFVALALLGGSWSLVGRISPSSDVFLPFLSLFLFFSRGLAGDDWSRRGVGGRWLTATSSVVPSACDSSSSSRLVFFRYNTIAFGTSIVSLLLLTWVKGRGLELMLEDSAKSGRSNTSKSSSKPTTSSTWIVSSCSFSFEPKGITFSSVVYCLGRSTWWVPSRGGLVINPGTAKSIKCSQGSLALIMFLGDWKLEEIGLYPRMMWVARN